jgi:hypothetical protein
MAVLQQYIAALYCQLSQQTQLNCCQQVFTLYMFTAALHTRTMPLEASAIALACMHAHMCKPVWAGGANHSMIEWCDTNKQ